MQEGHHPALQERTQVDKDVSQTYEIKPGEGRIPGEVVLREHACLPDALDYLIPRVEAREESLEPFGETSETMLSG